MRKTPKYIYVILFLLIILIVIFFMVLKLNNKSILVIPEIVSTFISEQQDNQKNKQEEKVKDKEIEKIKKDLKEWSNLTKEDKDKYKNIDTYKKYLKTGKIDYGIKEDADAIKQKDEINKGDEYVKDKSSGAIRLEDKNLALFPIESWYKLGGIYYNGYDEIPIENGLTTDTTVSFRQQNKKYYMINTYTFETSAQNVKDIIGGNFETIADNIERSISGENYNYVINTPNGAFSLIAIANNDIEYYDDLVINRLNRTY